MSHLPDIQKTKPKIRSAIQRVGVSNVELPFLLLLRDRSSSYYIQVSAKTEMLCKLDENTRGISMSRFLRTLQPYLRKPLKRTALESILKDFVKSHDTDTASIKFEFKIPLIVGSPLSDNAFPQYYKCSFRSDYFDGDFKFYESVRVQYSAYCPCSASLSENGRYGFPHNQRAFADILVRTNPKAYVWLEDLIDLVENAVKIVPYPIIKRVDEKHIAGQAKIYSYFVEDAIRIISQKLNKNKNIIDWYVRCTHEESIHTSNAVSMMWKGIEGGFNENTYI
jgi:GTP cyclohydrolase I